MNRILNKFLKPFDIRNTKDGQAGMSIIEIIIVLALIGGLMGVIVTNVIKQSENAKQDTAKLEMQRISESLTMYRVDNNRYPRTEQGLDALLNAPSDAKKWRGPYCDKDKLIDPWDGEYSYESDGRAFRIVSAGPDENEGTADDISFPEDSGDEGGDI
jgi:general secretion pathway protein G